MRILKSLVVSLAIMWMTWEVSNFLMSIGTNLTLCYGILLTGIWWSGFIYAKIAYGGRK